jgi:MFS family permease
VEARSRRRLTVLRDRDFARFFAGYATSLLGTSMSSLAVSFAVLDNGGTAGDLGVVLAAGIVPQVLFMLGGGVIADRLGRRPVMLGADAARCAAQAVLAAAVLAGRPALWVFILLAVARGTGEAAFTPALSGLTAELAPRDDLVNANALLTGARSAAAVAGPGLAGVLVAVAGPGTVIALDAGSYAVSVLALASLRLPAAGASAAVAHVTRSYLDDLRDGWAEFRGRAWLVVTTLQFTLFNLLTWGPFLLLGPVLCRDYLGGAGAWVRSWPAMAPGPCSARCWPWGVGRATPWSPRPWPRSATACPAPCLRCVGRWPRSPPGPWWPAWDLPWGAPSRQPPNSSSYPQTCWPGSARSRRWPRSRSARSRSPRQAQSLPCSVRLPYSGSGPSGPR